MPQMLSIQPAAPHQAPPLGQPSNKGQSQFSPHLERAISDKKTQRHTTNGKSEEDSSPSADDNTLSKSGKAKDKPKVAKNKKDSSPDTDRQELQTPLKAEDISEKSANLTVAQGTAGSSQATGERTVSAEYQMKTMPDASSASARMQPALSLATLQQDAEVKVSPGLGKADNLFAAFKDQIIVPPGTAEPVTGKNGASILGNRQDALTSQLQQIIESSNESGTVSITRTGPGTGSTGIMGTIHYQAAASFAGGSENAQASVSSEVSDLNLSGLLIANEEGTRTGTVKPTLHLSGARTDSQQQYFHVKLGMQNLAESHQNFQKNEQGDEFLQQTIGFGLQSATPNGLEQTSTFSQFMPIAPETALQPGGNSTQPIILPSGAMVHEHEIIQQLTERFQISGRHLDSRINLKLHPAELGELKIDLTVKEGSIRANVVAQSHHTLQILEKNIPKLRAALEGQGFTIDQISVSADSESVGEFDLFDRQLFSQQDYTPIKPKSRRDGKAVFALADNEYAPLPSRTGVNVKI